MEQYVVVGDAQKKQREDVADDDIIIISCRSA
jgi:hypothetical protein